jgi:hypothetical protein
MVSKTNKLVSIKLEVLYIDTNPHATIRISSQNIARNFDSINLMYHLDSKYSMEKVFIQVL